MNIIDSVISHKDATVTAKVLREVPTVLTEPLPCGQPRYAHIGQHSYCSWSHLCQTLKTGP